MTLWSALPLLDHAIYNLYAVSNHSGTTMGGHYTAYCKNPVSGEWHGFNDSRYSFICFVVVACSWERPVAQGCRT